MSDTSTLQPPTPTAADGVSYGTIRYKFERKKFFWEISCKPQVKALLRRLFPEIDQFTRGALMLSDTPEHCRDLLWFCSRYPMTIEPANVLEEHAKNHREMESKVARLLSAVEVTHDFELALPARMYQAIAAALCETRKGLLLGDKTGLGKSVTAMCPMTKAENLPVLVVTLTHLTDQWQDYLKKFAPNLKTHIIKSTIKYDITQPPKTRKKKGVVPEAPRMPDVIICNYAKLHSWIDFFPGLIKYVVFDEIQELRRNESNKYVAAKAIADEAKLRMGLSATPIYNYGEEFYNVMDVVMPGALGTPEEFSREWCRDKSLVDPKAFGEYLRSEGLFLVRTRKDVGRELPPVNQIIETIDADLSVLNKIKSSATDLAKVILQKNQDYRNQKFKASGQFDMLMRQATGIAKAPYVADFVKMLLETSEEKVVLFGWHHEVYDIWAEQLKEYKPVFYTGRESPSQKKTSKEAFIKGDSRVMVISLRAGAGLDGIQDVCRTGVIGELDWSPGVHIQNTGRIDRDPSSGDLDSLGPCFMYYMLSNEGSDPVIADVLGIKTTQLEGVIKNEDEDSLTELQVDPDHVKKLAQRYLKSQGLLVEDPEEDVLEAEEA